jgi:hypothetical protein
VRRRDLIRLLGGTAAWPLTARAQQARKIHTIGYLSPAVPSAYAASFFDALSELGWVEGQNIAVERRFAENRLERLPELAGELVRLKVEVIAASGTLGPLAAKRASSGQTTGISSFATPAAAQSGTIADSATFVLTAGNKFPGDGGAATFQRVQSLPSAYVGDGSTTPFVPPSFTSGGLPILVFPRLRLMKLQSAPPRNRFSRGVLPF